MAKFTLFELHIDGVDITAPEFGAGADETADDSAESGGRLGAALLAVGALAAFAVVAIVVKKRLGGSEDAPSLDAAE